MGLPAENPKAVEIIIYIRLMAMGFSYTEIKGMSLRERNTWVRVSHFKERRTMIENAKVRRGAR